MPAFIYVPTYIMADRDRTGSFHPPCFLWVRGRRLSSSRDFRTVDLYSTTGLPSHQNY